MSTNYKLKTEGGLKAGAEPMDIITRFERIPTYIAATAEDGAFRVAAEIAETIKAKSAAGQKCVLALTAGKSPIGVYRELVRRHKSEGLSFKNVVLFTLFEFYPINPTEQQSYTYSLYEELINQVDIPANQIHTLDGTVPASQVSEYCKQYEAEIHAAGGIDILLLGMGDQGQIALNEGGTYQNTRTRVVALSNASRKRVSSSFYGIENVPTRALTIGIATVMQAKRIVLIGWGEDKSEVAAKVVEGSVDGSIPASYLQNHANVEVVLDEDSASHLTRVATPWLVGSCVWTNRFIRKAVLWLCQKVKKPSHKVTYQDYIDNSLVQLIDETGLTYDKINIQVFNDLQHTISGWPGGKPNADDSTRPARSFPFPKRVVIFSPHPDDDVISMGGTFIRLADQGHDVHVAYQTSGNIAVHDDVVLQTLDTARECGFEDKYEHFKKLIQSKVKGQPEPLELRKIKGAIRRGEARAADRSFGLNDDTNVHFLNLPFYETGSVKKGAISPADIDIVIELLRKIQPHQT